MPTIHSHWWIGPADGPADATAVVLFRMNPPCLDADYDVDAGAACSAALADCCCCCPISNVAAAAAARLISRIMAVGYLHAECLVVVADAAVWMMIDFDLPSIRCYATLTVGCWLGFSRNVPALEEC